ncbi:longitudinals lacking protein, isoforms H/M/V isoform X1 [Eupeodes corollae]|uniref:longitudinals lacking protein, isoforms H/M/V isoform X1 n=1 Tax=Eupeodes corollae TaxID=290404 RepID=UPI0024901B45|nr:longitudinals lacking protein, isoforms H/M/V isoform X1 [Eupeodes corollae]XP_055910239.1 longitudinals lacking protein, isoforms H/M/V isoform X1 [Eupeodes corollae]XP_055910240.1 longitudinals lacking protein, isoforms H/M/V isoform X1 [Eupeodes corollae]
MTEKMASAHSQEFCVRWNSHLGSLGAAFPQLLAGQRFVDVTLACEGHQLHCHRLVLAACSSYFESILAENPCKHPVIILPRDIKLWEIQALVDFMYKGEVNVTQAGLPNLLKCAESLRIRGLYGSDAALNLNQLRQMAKAARTASATGVSANASQQQQSSATMENTECTEELQSTEFTEQTKINSIPQDSTASNSNGPLDVNPSTHESQEQVAPNVNDLPVASNCSTATTSSCSSSNTSTVTASVSNQTIALNVVEQANFMNQSNIMKTESVATEPFDDSTIAYDNFEDYPKPEDDAYPSVNDEDSFAGDNDESMMMQMNMDSPNNSYKRVRRSEASLAQAAKCVSKGQTFQTVSNMFNIPVSTIRFYMARKGILPKRKRGRGSSNSAVMTGAVMTHALDHIKRSSSPPMEPPFQFVGYKLPAHKPNLI